MATAEFTVKWEDDKGVLSWLGQIRVVGVAKAGRQRRKRRSHSLGSEIVGSSQNRVLVLVSCLFICFFIPVHTEEFIVDFSQQSSAVHW